MADYQTLPEQWRQDDMAWGNDQLSARQKGSHGSPRTPLQATSGWALHRPHTQHENKDADDRH